MPHQMVVGGNSTRYRRRRARSARDRDAGACGGGEAGSILTSRNAADGLQTAQDQQGRVWASNPAMGNELQLIYTVQPGDGLSAIAGKVYGNPGAFRELRTVPQNVTLQGPDINTGLHPGDCILIPGLPQPAGVGSPAVPGGAPPPIAPPVPVATIPGTVPATIPGTVPGTIPGTVPTGILVGTPATGTAATTESEKKKKKSIWTPLTVGLAVGAAGLGVWALSGGKKRRQRRRR